MNRRKKASPRGVASIQEELASIGDDLAALGSSLGEHASEEARATMKTIRARLDRIASDAGIVTRDSVGAIQETIEANPFTSVAVAFGLGVVLASLLRR